jgi:metal-responsive CopG/Arc/MetJ family transcriptional regulator
MIKTRRTYGLGSSTLSIVIPTEFLLELNNLASASGISRNKLIKYAVEDLLKKEGKKDKKTDNNFIIVNQALNAHVDQ